MADYSGGQKSKLTKRLFFLLVVLAAAVICVAVLAGRKRNAKEEEPEEKLNIYIMDNAEEDSAGEAPEEESGEASGDGSEEMLGAEASRETPKEITFSLISQEEMNLMGYEKLTGLSASCGLDQYTPAEYQVASALDGDVNTCWLAYGPAVGSGIGEDFTIRLGEEREVKYLLLNLGNWADFSHYETITSLEIEVGDVGQTVHFSEEQTQFAVELSETVPASFITLTVWGISDSESRSNCACISEVEVYARVKVQKGS